MDDRRRLGALTLAVGFLLIGVGAVGALTEGSGGPVTGVAATPSPPAATPSPSPTPPVTARPTPVSTPSPTPDDETLVRAFIAGFVPAIRAEDLDFLVPRLHEATIERYGEAACRDFIGRLDDPGFDIVVQSVGPRGPYTYRTDELATVVSDVWPVPVEFTSHGETSLRDLHLAYVDGDVRWFTDCGTPLGASPAP